MPVNTSSVLGKPGIYQEETVPWLRWGEMKWSNFISCCHDPVPQQDTIYQFLRLTGSYFKRYIFSPCTQWMQLISMVGFVTSATLCPKPLVVLLI